MKNYKYAMTNKKPVGESVSYLTKFSEIMSARVDSDRFEKEKWTLADI